jgi:hypothetical protein
MVHGIAGAVVDAGDVRPVMSIQRRDQMGGAQLAQEAVDLPGFRGAALDESVDCKREMSAASAAATIGSDTENKNARL